MTMYYVDSVLGNDGNLGTSTNAPWSTMLHVNDGSIVSGDTVAFARGREWLAAQIQVNVPTLTLDAYGSGLTPRLIASTSGTIWAAVGDGTYTMPFVANLSSIELLVENRLRYSYPVGSVGELVAGTHFFDNATDLLHMQPLVAGDPNGSSWLIGGYHTLVEVQALALTSLTLRNLHLLYAGKAGLGPWYASDTQTHGDVLVEDCTFTGCGFSGIVLSGAASYANMTFRRNTFHEIGAEGIYVGINAVRTSCTIEDNVLGSVDDQHWGWRGEGQGSAFNGDGIDVKYGNPGVVIQQNTLHLRRGGFCISTQSSGSTITDNTITKIDLDQGECAGIELDPQENTNGVMTCSNNTMTGVCGTGIKLRGSTSADTQMTVTGNTIMLTTDSPYAYISLDSTNNTNMTITSNVCQGGRGPALIINGETPVNLTITGNTFTDALIGAVRAPTVMTGATIQNNLLNQHVRVPLMRGDGTLVTDQPTANTDLGDATAFLYSQSPASNSCRRHGANERWV